jgi:hypothetical protein
MPVHGQAVTLQTPGRVSHGHIVIAGRRRAAKIKRRSGAVITIENLDQHRNDQVRFSRVPAPDHLVLAFEDIEENLPNVIGPSPEPDATT